jgi:hypothetical protein
VAFGLALLAGAGLAQAMHRWKRGWLAWAIPGLLFCDLFWFNSANNPLTYSRNSFAELYGSKLAQFEDRLGSKLPPLTRIHATYSLPAFGPQNHPLDARVEATYGYNPLRLRSYAEYLGAAAANPKLLAGLGARFRLNPQSQGVESTDDILPRVTIPGTVITVANDEEATRQLRSLDPSKSALVSGIKAVTQDPAGSAAVTSHEEGLYRIKYQLKSPTLVRAAEVYYPGWRADANGRELAVVAVDRALMGVVVPAGEGELTLRFRTRRWTLLAAISAGAALVWITLIVILFREKRQHLRS